MGQHKYNQTALLAKQGKLPPKEQKKRVNNGNVEDYLIEKGIYSSKLREVLYVAQYLKNHHY